MATSSPREVYFNMPNGKPILCHPSLRYLSEFLEKFFVPNMDSKGTDPDGIPVGDNIGRKQIELLNKFATHMETYHRETLVGEHDDEFWMGFIVSCSK